MQRIVIIFSILLALAAPAWAAEVDAINGIPISKLKAINGVSITKIKAHNGFPIASALTCTVLTANSTSTTTLEVNRYNAAEYIGTIFDDDSTGKFCKVRFYFQGNTGDLALLDYYAEIWTIGGSNALDTLIARSDKVDGVDSWFSTLVDFTFSTPPDYDCTTNQYGVLLKALNSGDDPSTAGKYSATNFATTRYYNGTNNMTHTLGRYMWSSATGAAGAGSDANDMLVMEIWTMQ